MNFLGPIFLPFLEWLFHLFGNLGWAIIAFTIIVRLGMLPLTLKQLRSQRKIMVIQPKLRELQRKYSKDREKLTQETMKLYREHGANPVGGCLPLLISLPILFGVWQAIQLFGTSVAATAEQVQFLWLPRLTPLVDEAGKAITGSAKDPYYILPILAVGLQFITTLMAMQRNPDPQQAPMNKVMMFMPFIFGFIYFQFPAGATLYSVTGSLIQIVQQYFTSGFGLLSKYLPFLPEKTGFLHQPLPESATITIDEPEDSSEQPQRRDFWAALGKLEPVVDVSAAGATADSGSSDIAAEQAIEDVKAQLGKPKKRR